MKGDASKIGRSKPFKYGRYGFVSDRGLNPKRVTNEDSYLLLEDVPLFAVADGVGGQNAGEVASQVAVEIVRHHFAKKKVAGDKAQYLEQVICYANRYLYDMAVDDDMLSGMATTVALVLLEKKRATVGHVGDSRVYRFTDGKLYRETIDHSLAEDVRYAAHLDGESVNKNIITRALGVEPDVEPETKIIPIPPNTSFLLCTDGITRHVTDDELTDILRTVADPQAVCDLLKEMCYERGAKDNLTAILVKLDAPPRRIGLAAEATATASAPPKLEQRDRIARIQVELMDREAAEPEAVKPLENTMPAGTQTFSSQLARPDSFVVLPLSPWRRVLIPLLLALALVVGAFTGIYVQQVLSPTSPDTQTDQELTPAQHAFEEGRRAFVAGQYTAARDAFAQAVSLNSKIAAYYHWLAETQVILKEYHAGAENFWKAASLSGVADDYLHAAMAYYAAGEKEKAAEALAASLNAKH